MLFAYFPMMVIESFASIMIEALRANTAPTMPRLKNAKPTIIMME